jgi:hypothetical protein
MSNQSFASAVRTATLVGDDNPKVSGNHGCKVILDVTAVPGVETVQLVIEGKDKLSGKYWTVLQSAAQVAVGTYVLTVLPGIAVSANVSASDSLPDVYRVRVVHSASGNWTYTLAVVELQ